MREKRIVNIRLPCNLKSKVKRLARSNGLTCSELVGISIEAKLPDYESEPLQLFRLPIGVPSQDS